MSLDIVFEDSDLIVLNKPAGQVVHPDKNNSDNTLVDELIKYYSEINDAIIDPSDLMSRERAGMRPSITYWTFEELN